MARGALMLATLALASRAWAGEDYDPASESWNGLSGFVALAQSAGVHVVEADAVDFDRLDPKSGLIIVYPTTPLDWGGLSHHLRRGGRVLLADDFGSSAVTLERLAVRRDERPVRGSIAFRTNEHLPVAVPVDEGHLLARGVRRLVANHPATFETDLPPVFVAGRPPRTLVTVGALGPGRVVLLGDPSVLINNMLAFRGNAAFARNLVEFIAPDRSAPAILLRGSFAQRSSGTSMSTSAAAAAAALNSQLAQIDRGIGSWSRRGPPAGATRVMALLLAVVVLALLLARFGLRPRLYEGSWLRPAAAPRPAGYLAHVGYFSTPGADHSHPTMILKRQFEERLLDGLDMQAPARLGAVLDAFARKVPSPSEVSALRRLLTWLGGVAAASAAGVGGATVPARELKRGLGDARRLLRYLGRTIEE